MGTAKTDQTGRMCRLICVFPGGTGYFVGFVMLQLSYVNRYLVCHPREKTFFKMTLERKVFIF